MARGYIATVDSVHHRRLDLGPGTKIAWSSGRAWPGLVLERLVHGDFETPDFVIENHCVVLHVSPAARVEHKFHGIYRGFLHGPGNICLFSGGTARQVRSRDPHSVLVLTISPQIVRQAVEASDVAQPMLIEHVELRDRRIESIVRCLELEAQEGHPSGALYGDSLGLALASYLAHKHSIPGSRTGEHKGGMAPKRLRRVVEFIDEHLKDDLRLSALAEVAGLSEHRFAHNFKATTGLPPHRYVTSQKIARAKRLLRESGMSVTEIGYSLGFSQPSQFSSVFGRWTGVPPSEYRRRTQ